MSKLSAILAAIALAGTTQLAMAGDGSSTGGTDSDVQLNEKATMQNDRAMNGDEANRAGASTEGSTTGKGKQLNQGKTQTEPVDEGGRIKTFRDIVLYEAAKTVGEKGQMSGNPAGMVGGTALKKYAEKQQHHRN